MGHSYVAGIFYGVKKEVKELKVGNKTRYEIDTGAPYLIDILEDVYVLKVNDRQIETVLKVTPDITDELCHGVNEDLFGIIVGNNIALDYGEDAVIPKGILKEAAKELRNTLLKHFPDDLGLVKIIEDNAELFLVTL